MALYAVILGVLLHPGVLTVGSRHAPRDVVFLKCESSPTPESGPLPPIYMRLLTRQQQDLSRLEEYRRTVTYEGQVIARCAASEIEKHSLLEHDGVDVLGSGIDGDIDIRMQRKLFQEIQRLVPECRLLVEDVETFIVEREREFLRDKMAVSWFETYHTYSETVNWYSELAAASSDIVKFVPSIGKSVEGRDMPAVHITASTSEVSKKIYFQCQIHAREWITGATCMYIANHLAENYDKDERVTALLNSLEFIFVPFVNPDGYAYTWSNDRLWRKNRRKGKLCDGVDLNRNYNIQWGGPGSSGSECGETYRGPSVESEPETQNIANYFQQNGPILGAIDFHSYSQLILRPWGYTNESCPDEEQLKGLAVGMSQAAYGVHHMKYTPERGIQLYTVSGSAQDWFYSEDAAAQNKGFRAAGLTIELRDTGQYGCLLPPDQITPTGQEMVPTVIYFAEHILSNPILYQN